MKKVLCLLMIAVLCLSLVACNNSQSPDASDDTADGAPSFIGMTYDDVINTPIYTEKYTIEKSEQYSDTVEAGIITDQSPRPGQSMRSNVIRVVVSKGPRYATTATTQALNKRVPRVTGQSVEEAADELKQKGFVFNEDNVVYVNNSEYERGVVLSQEPENGKYALTGTEVVLTVSSGYVNATVSVYFPQEERTVDLEVYVDGKKQAASDLGVSLTNLLMMDLQSFSFTPRVPKNSYKLDIRMSPSGTKQFQAYASYTVNGKTGEVTQNGTYTLPR